MPGPRILLVADLHYTLRQLDWVADVADQFDLVVLAGDLLDVSSTVPLEVQILAMRAYLRHLSERAPVVVCSGNHDLDGPDGDGEQAANWMAGDWREGLEPGRLIVDGESRELPGVLVTVCPWWDGPLGQARVGEQLQRDAARRPERWIWVYHWPPVDSPVSWTGHGYYGDADLRRWIEEHQPDLVLTGHVHETPFKPDGSWIAQVGATWVFNAGRQIGPEPTRVEIDLGEGTATWFSLMGNEDRLLAAT